MRFSGVLMTRYVRYIGRNREKCRGGGGKNFASTPIGQWPPMAGCARVSWHGP